MLLEIVSTLVILLSVIKKIMNINDDNNYNLRVNLFGYLKIANILQINLFKAHDFIIYYGFSLLLVHVRTHNVLLNNSQNLRDLPFTCRN